MSIEFHGFRFKLKDQNRGSISGGIDPPRILFSAEGRGDEVLVKWKYSPTGGYGGHLYHTTDKSIHKDAYRITDGKLEVNGVPDTFGVDKDCEWDTRSCMEGVMEFCRRWGLEVP